MVALAGVHAEMTREVATSGEAAVAGLADMFFLGRG